MDFELLSAIVKAVAYGAALSGAGIVLAGATLPLQAGVGPTADAIRRAAGAVLTTACVTRLLLLYFGLGGEPSAALLGALFASRLGVAIALQAIGGALLWRGETDRMRIGAGALIIASFGIAGHGPTNGILTGLVVAAHVGMASWWIGGLLVLYETLGTMRKSAAARLVHSFSRQAAIVVCVLFSAGFMTALTLLALRVDLARSYDAGLAVKVALAVALLALAAINKFTLTPWIRARRRSIRYLRYAIQIELVLAFGVICATAILTTYASPH